MTMSTAAQNGVDFDALLDLSEYDDHHSSPSLSPAPASKVTFASPISPSIPTPSICSSTSQTLNGPSHNYDMYRQQTGFVPGAIANTMAVNKTYNAGYQYFGSLEYIPTATPDTDLFDFNTSPSQGATDLSFESPTESQHLFSTVNPNIMEQDAQPRVDSPPMSTSGSVGRLWPGAHSQAALAKAQAQQRHQQQQQQQQPQQQRIPRQGPRPLRGKASQPCNPIVEQKISQLLNSMRAKASASEPHDKTLQATPPRTRKQEDDMDEDERLLASEEGKLSSKERRQLRNKVSARAFRSRRKEYISQLEAEIAVKVNENGDLRAENRALLDENKRLSDLTCMLLSSPSFSNFLDHLSVNPSTASPIRAEAQQQVPDQDQVPKNANPYRDQHSQQQQIGMAMIPEQSMEMAMLNFNGVSAYNFQPQFFVVETPEIDTALVASLLSGKTQDFGDETSQPDKESKVNVPVIERCAEDFPTFVAASSATPVEENFESDSGLALVHSEPSRTSRPTTTRIDMESLSVVDIDGHLDVDEVPTRHEVFNATERDASVITAMARVQRLSANIEPVVSKLELLTMDL